MAQHPMSIRFAFDPKPFQRSIWHAIQAFSAMADAVAGRPVRPATPLPRRLHPGTAREYRTARRRYGRDLRAWRKAVS